MGTRLRPLVLAVLALLYLYINIYICIHIARRLPAVTTVILVSIHSWAGQVELVSSDDRALLNPLAMMKQLAAINKWTGPQQTQQQVPKRAVLEAQVAARQQAARDNVSLVAETHKETGGAVLVGARRCILGQKGQPLRRAGPDARGKVQGGQQDVGASCQGAGACCRGQKAAAAEQKQSNAKGTHRAIWPTTTTKQAGVQRPRQNRLVSKDNNKSQTIRERLRKTLEDLYDARLATGWCPTTTTNHKRTIRERLRKTLEDLYVARSSVVDHYYISSEPSQATVGSETDNNIGAEQADAHQAFCNSSIKRKATTISAASHYRPLWDRQPTVTSANTSSKQNRAMWICSDAPMESGDSGELGAIKKQMPFFEEQQPLDFEVTRREDAEQSSSGESATIKEQPSLKIQVMRSGDIKYGNGGESTDIFTKGLPRVGFQRHHYTIMGE